MLEMVGDVFVLYGTIAWTNLYTIFSKYGIHVPFLQQFQGQEGQNVEIVCSGIVNDIIIIPWQGVGDALLAKQSYES